MWYAVYEKDTGQLLSVGTVLAETLPANRLVQALGEDQPDFTQLAWNAQALAFEPILAEIGSVDSGQPALAAKDSKDWTLADIADALKLLLNGRV